MCRWQSGNCLLYGGADAEKNQMIKANPMYGNIVCRCERITEAEIVEAILKYWDKINDNVLSGALTFMVRALTHEADPFFV